MSKSKQNAANVTTLETAPEVNAPEVNAPEVNAPAKDAPEVNTPAKDAPEVNTPAKDDEELKTLMLKRAVFETDPKTVMLEALAMGDKCLPFLSSVVPSKKFKASSMGSVFAATKELAAMGKLTHLLTLATGTKGKVEGAKKLLGMLEAREKLNNGAGEKLLELLPINQ